MIEDFAKIVETLTCHKWRNTPKENRKQNCSAGKVDARKVAADNAEIYTILTLAMFAQLTFATAR